MSDRGLEYQKSHPWLRFGLDLGRASPKLWMLLGEARSKCEHLGRIPLPPQLSKDLHTLYMAKGVHGTTAIEGNTLTEEQIKKILAKELELPPSLAYLRQEVENIVVACEEVACKAIAGDDPRITPELLGHFNGLVLRDLELEPRIIPGRVRDHDVGVMRYPGPHWVDCNYLLSRLCDWLNDWTEDDFQGKDIIRAVVAHLYLAWIHPFGDGNGRTARLLEFHILVNSGVPTLAAHLLSNHYNLTRTRYLQELDKASRIPHGEIGFITYALEGLVDQLREQIAVVQAQQLMLSWRDWVNEHFRDGASPVHHRRRDLLLALSWRERPIKKAEIRTLSPLIEEAYRDKTQKTITRDLNWLEEQALIERKPEGFVARTGIILGFLPERRVPGDSATHIE